MFQPFQKYLQNAAIAYGIKTEMKAAEICHNFRAMIPKVFQNAENPERHIRPAYFRNGKLMIKVENQAWGQEVIMRKERIIEELNTKTGEKIIKDIKTMLEA